MVGGGQSFLRKQGSAPATLQSEFTFLGETHWVGPAVRHLIKAVILSCVKTTKTVSVFALAVEQASLPFPQWLVFPSPSRRPDAVCICMQAQVPVRGLIRILDTWVEADKLVSRRRRRAATRRANTSAAAQRQECKLG